MNNANNVTMDKEKILLTEDKATRFVKFAERRVPNALRLIKSIANLSNKRYYEYSDEQANKVINALKDAVKELERQFKKKSEKEFKL
jgi:hypothetical protein